MVHPVGAVCVRRARCVLPPLSPPSAAGTAVRILVEGVPVTAYGNSLRGRVVSGPPGLRVTDTRLERAAVPRPDGELPRLRLELEEAENRREDLRVRRDGIRAEIAEVAGLRAVPPRPRRGDPPRRAPVESLLALADFVDDRLALLHERLRSVEEEVRDAEHEADVLAVRSRDASSALSTGRTRESVTTVLTLDGGGDGNGPDGGVSGVEAEFEIEYHVPGATWSPVHHLRLGGADTARDGTLVLRAHVAQRTGEDWRGVRLALSTADLSRFTGGAPRLRSLRIGRRREEPEARGWREPPPGLEELFSGYDAAVAPRPHAPAPPVEAAVSAAAAPASPTPAATPPRTGGGVPPVAMPLAGTLPHAPDASTAPSPAAVTPGAGRVGPGAERGFAGYGAPRATAASGGSVLPEATSPPPPVPSTGMLDYSRLELAGPDEPGRRGRLRPAPEVTDADTAERRRAEAVARWAPPAPTVLPMADVRHSAGSFHRRYDTAAPVDVVADGAWHTVPVCDVPVETVPEYVCVPSVDRTVYGTVLLTNTSHHALPAGPADITVGGEFLLTAPLPALAPGERRRVGIGAAESVRVARRARVRESTAGLRGGTTVLDHTVEVELVNHFPHRVTVEVRERVPVSTEKEVRIEEHRATPPWAVPNGPFDGDVGDGGGDGGDGSVDGGGDGGGLVRGARVWRVELDPGRTTVLRGGYEIRIPGGKALIGGNHREREAP
ncbi:DUF4139 domain-containing protein [Streptomyces sp. TRM43335]|uniref:DUF4139 domain-containing protein n=1 Tax=Streptomyces taklimakanensis TaxID=2569853 RepID=A0A6G2B6K5_9ACTN|nr:DUF4139 domain-containing protein [Streptomyces taklimakanensis]